MLVPGQHSLIGSLQTTPLLVFTRALLPAVPAPGVSAVRAELPAGTPQKAVMQALSAKYAGLQKQQCGSSQAGTIGSGGTGAARAGAAPATLQFELEQNAFQTQSLQTQSPDI